MSARRVGRGGGTGGEGGAGGSERPPGPGSVVRGRTPTANQAWVLLLGSAVLEAVWATALGSGIGAGKPVATLVFALALAGSMLGLGQAARVIPIGTAYAVWTGLGAALTVLGAMVSGAQDVHWGQLAFIAGLVGCTLGLKLVEGRGGGAERASVEEPEPSGG